MSKISREEFLNELKNAQCEYCNSYEDDCNYCCYGKAISDMQKLEKIEKRIAEFQNGTDMFKGMDEAYVVFAIEDILKEV